MPIDPTLQTPQGYATPQQLAAMRAYSQQLLKQSSEPAQNPKQGMAHVVQALLGGATQSYSDTKESNSRQQAAQLLEEKYKQGDIPGMIGLLSNPYVNQEAVKLGVARQTPTRVQMGSGTVLQLPTGQLVPGSFLPEDKIVTEEAGGVKTQRVLRGNERGGYSDIPIQEAGGGASSPASMSGGPIAGPPATGPRPGGPIPSSSSVVGDDEAVNRGLYDPIKPTPVKTVPAAPISRIDRLAADSARYEANKTAAVEDVKKYANKAEKIENRARDAQDEIPQLQMLSKVISNGKYYSGLLHGEVGILDQIGSMFGLSSGQTATLQQFAKKLGSAGSLEQVREMGEQGAVRIPEMKMIEKSNYDPENRPEANAAVVELRLRAAQRSVEIADMKNKYAQTGNIDGRPGRGNNRIDAGFDQQVRDHYRDKPLITPDEMTRYEALAKNPKTNQGVVAPIAGEPMKISDRSSYNALPKGQQYIAPDGSLRTKQ